MLKLVFSGLVWFFLAFWVNREHNQSYFFFFKTAKTGLELQETGFLRSSPV